MSLAPERSVSAPIPVSAEPARRINLPTRYLVWLGGLAVFVAMAVGAHYQDEFQGDETFSHEFQELSFFGSNQLEEFADVVGATEFVLAAGLVLAVLFWVMQDRTLALLAPAVLVFRAIGTPIKELVQRERPDAEEAILREFPAGYSFPSGHALGAALLFGLCIVIAERKLSGWTRRAVQGLAVAAILVVGGERIYDGAHWPSDVLGGYLLGALVLTGVIWVTRRIAGTQRLRPSSQGAK